MPTVCSPTHHPALNRQKDVARLLLVTGALLLAGFVPFYLATVDLGWPIARDGTGLVVGRDFLNFWLYGRAAWEAEPARYYDLPTYWRVIEAVAGTDYPGQQWSYPPSVMWLAAPFGLLSYGTALALWTGVGICAFASALRLWTRDGRLLGAAVLSPAAVFGIMSGQMAFLGAAATLGVLRWRETRPIVAGLLLGTMTVKPQLGLLFPVLLAATRAWRVIAVAAATGLAIAGGSAVLWGLEAWRQYFAVGVASQATVLTDPALIVAPFMPTAFVSLRLAGASVALAYGGQALLAIGAAAMVWAIFRQQPTTDDRRANALFAAAGAIATPYLMAYDCLALTAAAALFAAASGRARTATLLVVLLPLVQMALGGWRLPGAALVPIGYAAWLWRLTPCRPAAVP